MIPDLDEVSVLGALLRGYTYVKREFKGKGGYYSTTVPLCNWREEMENMKTSLKYLQLWIPFIYSMAVSGIALFGWAQSTISLPAGFPAFVGFLPMAFFFSAI